MFIMASLLVLGQISEMVELWFFVVVVVVLSSIYTLHWDPE